jgi:hypothetical protein
MVQAALAGQPRVHAGPVSVRPQGMAGVLRSAAAHRSLGYRCSLARHEGELLLQSCLAAGSEACAHCCSSMGLSCRWLAS